MSRLPKRNKGHVYIRKGPRTPHLFSFGHLEIDDMIATEQDGSTVALLENLNLM